MHRSRGLRLLSFGTMVLAGIALALGSLTYTDRQAQAQTPEEDIVATVEAAVAAWNAQDWDAFTALFTSRGLGEFFGIGEDDDAAAILAEEFAFTGPIVSSTVTDLFVTSGNASGIVELQFGSGFGIYEEWSFLFMDGGWKINGTEPASRPIPEGVPVVDMVLQEYAFVYNEAAILAADGNFAFDVTNIGQEEHEIVIFGIDSNDSLLEILQSSSEPESPDDLPPGLEFVTFGGVFEPGQDGTVVLDQPLTAGRYGLVCFLPAPDGTPHAFLGMVSEFEIGALAPDDDDDGAAPIRPPSTGDAGLLGTGAGTTTSVLYGVALILVLGGITGLLATRRA